MKILKFVIFGLIFFTISKSCNSQQLYFPPIATNDWETISPASLGWCTDKIDSLYNFLESRNTKSFMVLKNGKIVLEKYFGTFTSDSLWYWASAGKTLTSMLVGIAQKEGYLSVEQPVSDFLGQGWTSCTPEKENLIKIRNQLTMTTGLDEMVSDPDCTLPACYQYLADAGTRWAYHNAAYTILDQVVSSATGMNFSTYFNSKIRNKIGMNGLWAYLDYNHIYFSNTRSMARYGLLLLAKGKWENHSVIQDSSYYDKMINSSQNLNKSYGYLTWLNGKDSYMLPQSQFVFSGALCPAAPSDMYAAMGKNGQLINVVPSQNLVVIRMGNAPDNQFEVANMFDNLVWQELNKVICNTDGISEQTSQSQLTVFPNPATNEIHISLPDLSKNYKVWLFNSQGQLKFQELNCKNIDVSNFPAGVYVLIIYQNGVKSRYLISVTH